MVLGDEGLTGGMQFGARSAAQGCAQQGLLERGAIAVEREANRGRQHPSNRNNRQGRGFAS